MGAERLNGYAALASLDRSQSGPTAPARGLCLEWLRYPTNDGTGPLSHHESPHHAHLY